MIQLVGLYFAILSFGFLFVFPVVNTKNVLGVSRVGEVISPLSNNEMTKEIKVSKVATISPITPTVVASISSIPVKKRIKAARIKSAEITITPELSVSVVNVSVSKQEYLIQKINEYRRSNGLGDVVSNDQTCSFARIRAEEISRDFSHAGFRSRIDSKTLPYPDYKNVTENIAMNSEYTKVVEMWINSAGHAENMRKDTPFVCVGVYQNYYAYEGFKP